jgi:hypothetical protein
MKDPTRGLGTIMVLLERLNKDRLPRALALKERVDRGEKLTDRDRKFLKESSENIRRVTPLVANYPDYQPLLDKLTNLTTHIARKAQENDQQS